MVTPGPDAERGAPLLSLVVPCYNCAGLVSGTVEALRRHLEASGHGWEMVLVDDGSEDGTGAVLEGHARDARIRAVRLPANRGKGGAVAEGMVRARGRYRIFTDADLPYRLDGLDACREGLMNGAHAVFGNRRLPSSDVGEAPLMRRWVGWGFRTAMGWMLGRNDLDTQCGLKGFSGPLADILFPALRVEGFLFDVELCLLLTEAGIAIESVPVVLLNQDVSTVRPLRTGVQTVAEAWRIWRDRARSDPALDALRTLAGETG